MPKRRVKPKKREKKGDPDKLKVQLKEKEELAKHYLEELQYLQAEFDNYRKREDEQRREFVKYANEGLIIQLLDVLDNLERAITVLREGGKDVQGLEMVYDQLSGILEKHGVKKIDALGKKFDPYYHEALMRADKANAKEPKDTIIAEFQRGYMLNSKVIRHSKVKISK